MKKILTILFFTTLTVIFPETETLIISGLPFKGEISHENGNRVISDANIELLKNDFRDISLNFKEILVDNKGNILEPSEGSVVHYRSIGTTNIGALTLTKAILTPEGDLGPGLYIDGYTGLYEYEHVGNIDFTNALFQNDELVFPPNNKAIFRLGESHKSFKEFKIGSFSHDPKSKKYKFTDVELLNPQKSNLIMISKMSLDHSGNIIDLIPVESVDSNNRWHITDRDLHYPGLLSSSKERYDDLYFDPNGDITDRYDGIRRKLWLGHLKINFTSQKIVKDGVIFEESKLGFLFNDISNWEIDCEKIELNNNGSATLIGAGKIHLKDREYIPEKLTGGKNEVTISGSTDGKRFSINYSTYGYLNSITIHHDTKDEIIFTDDSAKEFELQIAKEKAARAEVDASINEFNNLLDTKNEVGVLNWVKSAKNLFKSRKSKFLKERIEANDLWSVKMLLDNGCSLMNIGRSNPLIYSLNGSEDMMKLLLSYECDLLNSGGQYKSTLFDFFLKSYNYNIIKIGIEGGIIQETTFDTPLHTLINEDDIDDLIELYLSLGYNLMDKDKDGITVTEKAISSDQEDFVLKVIDKSAIDTSDDYWSQVLFTALEPEARIIVEDLLNRGISPNIYDNKGKHLYRILKEKGEVDLLSLAYDKGVIVPKEKTGTAYFSHEVKNQNSKNRLLSLHSSNNTITLNTMKYKDESSRFGLLETHELTIDGTHIIKDHGIFTQKSNINFSEINSYEKFKYDSMLNINSTSNVILDSLSLLNKDTTLVLTKTGWFSYNIVNLNNQGQIINSSSISIDGQLKAQKLFYYDNTYKLLTVTYINNKEIITLYNIDEDLKVSGYLKYEIDISAYNDKKEDIKRSFEADLSNTKVLYLEDKFSLLAKDDGSIIIGKSNREFNTFTIRKFSSKLNLLKSKSLNFHKVYDFKLLDYMNNILIVSQGYSTMNPGLWIVKLNKSIEPVSGFSIPVAGYSRDVIATITEFNGLAIVYSYFDNNYREKNHNYIYIKLDENLSGVAKNQLNIAEIGKNNDNK